MVLLPERGRLEETPLPGLLLDLYRARFNGSARLNRDHIEKTFLFHEGIPVFAESNLTSESLGVRLMDAGKISRNDYSKIVNHVERKGCKEGKALLELELIDPKGLFLALKEQVRLRIIECFGWARGSFSIEPSEGTSNDTQPFRADIFALLQEGIETHWTTDRILADLEPRMNQYARRTARLSRIQNRLCWDEAAENFIDSLDGTRTFWKSLQLATTPRALATAWVLDAAEVLDYCDDPARDMKPEIESEAKPEIEIAFSGGGEENVSESASETARPSRPMGKRVSPDRVAGPAAVRLRREIDEKFARLEQLNHYELLGVDAKADVSAIKRAYLNAAKTYHPDALARLELDEEGREHANKVFTEISRAHAVLSNPAKRREYDAALMSDAPAIDAEQLARAETLYRKGEILLRHGNFKGALEFLQPAVELYPEECDYQSALGWALYKKMPSDAQGAKTHLEHAARLGPENAVVLFRLGTVLRSLGETVAASTLLAKAKALDPTVR